MLLRNVSWETYERLIDEREERGVPRFFYDRGELEIISPSFEHEPVSRIFSMLVSELAVKLGIDVSDAGSTTFKREDLERGFEPDECFYTSPGMPKGYEASRIWISTRRGPSAARPHHRGGPHQPLLKQTPHLCAPGRRRGVALRRRQTEDPLFGWDQRDLRSDR